MNKNKALILLSLAVLGGGVINAATEQSIKIEEPEAITIVEPEVPYTQNRWGATDTVVVTFQINEDGRPVNIRMESYDDRIYAATVEEAIRKWRFKPPTVKGVTYRQVVNFG